jgi:DNA-binding HxlR family transcriptional regulator
LRPCEARIKRAHQREDDTIDRALTDFIHSTVRTLWTLELLMLLESDRDRAWSETELERELRASASIVRESLASLESAGLLERHLPERVRFTRRPGPSADLVAALALAYRETPAAVMRVVLSSPNAKLRHFATAFILRKD